jgi:thiol-disulfide isomerase/thioredoxin
MHGQLKWERNVQGYGGLIFMRTIFFRVFMPLMAVLGLFIFAEMNVALFAQEARAPTKRGPQGAKAGGKMGRTGSPTIVDPVVIDQQGFENVLTKYNSKPLLVNFWATWCEPCRDEYPMLNELAKKYAPEGLQVVGISLDDDGEMIMVRRFLARYKPVFPNFRKRPGNEEQFINVVNKEWSGSIPASFFYARGGRQIGQIVGEGKREVYEAAIRSVLGSSGKDSANSRPRSAADRH